MIKINLALRKQSAGATVTESTGAVTRSFRFNTQFEGFKDVPWPKFLAMGAVLIGAWYGLEQYKDSEMRKADVEYQQLDEELLGLRKQEEKTKKYEADKRELDNAEAVIRAKIDTVDRLVQERQTPPKLMTTLSAIVPKDIWLSTVNIKELEVIFEGKAREFAIISDFMKNVNESVYFTDVRLQNAEQGSEEGVNIAKFKISAKRRKVN